LENEASGVAEVENEGVELVGRRELAELLVEANVRSKRVRPLLIELKITKLMHQ